MDSMNDRKPHGNLQKYRNENPLQRFLIRRFQDAVTNAIHTSSARSVLDAGSGEGFTAEQVRLCHPGLNVVCVDMDTEALARGRSFFPELHFSRGDVRSLPFPDRSFDLVMCLEVLEHLENPSQALEEFRRVSRTYVLVSVPHEPWFRIANVLRGKNLGAFGNDPEHIQHWSPRSFRAFLEHNGMNVITKSLRFPWMLFLCEVRR